MWPCPCAHPTLRASDPRILRQMRGVGAAAAPRGAAEDFVASIAIFNSQNLKFQKLTSMPQVDPLEPFPRRVRFLKKEKKRTEETHPSRIVQRKTRKMAASRHTARRGGALALLALLALARLPDAAAFFAQAPMGSGLMQERAEPEPPVTRGVGGLRALAEASWRVLDGDCPADPETGARE